MSLVGHLSELRVRLTYAALAVFVGFFVAYAFHLELFELIVFPVRDSLAERGLYRLQALHVTESIFVYLKLSVVVGLMGAFPFILYQIWAFIAPGLLEEERRYVTPIVVFSTLFFGLGVLFAYTVLIPFVTGFLTDLTIGSSGIELQVTVQNVFSFSLLSLLLFGLVFQLPILMFFLALLGVADHRSFAGFFRFFIVISFVIGAMLTPPEPVSQILMALPMNLLYGLGIVFAFLVGKRTVDPETNELRPIGMRVWLTVAGVMALFVGGIVGGVWLLQPAPKGSNSSRHPQRSSRASTRVRHRRWGWLNPSCEPQDCGVKRLRAFVRGSIPKKPFPSLRFPVNRRGERSCWNRKRRHEWGLRSSSPRTVRIQPELERRTARIPLHPYTNLFPQTGSHSENRRRFKPSRRVRTMRKPVHLRMRKSRNASLTCEPAGPHGYGLGEPSRVSGPYPEEIPSEAFARFPGTWIWKRAPKYSAHSTSKQKRARNRTGPGSTCGGSNKSWRGKKRSPREG